MIDKLIDELAKREYNNFKERAFPDYPEWENLMEAKDIWRDKVKKEILPIIEPYLNLMDETDD